MYGGTLERSIRFAVGAELAGQPAATPNAHCSRSPAPRPCGCTDLPLDPKNRGACGVVRQSGAGTGRLDCGGAV